SGARPRPPARQLDDRRIAKEPRNPMKICRFDDNRVGLVQDGQVHDVTPVLAELGAFSYPLPRFDPFLAKLDALKSRMKPSKGIDVSKVRLLSPVANPGKVIAAPVNYTRHLQE